MAKNKRNNPPRNNENQTPKKENKEPEILEERSITEFSLYTNFWGNFKLHALLIMVLSGLLYVNTLSHKYAVDDAIVITRNQFTAKGFAGMGGIWGEDTFVGFFGDNKNLVMGGRYRPFSVATFALENQLFGTVVRNKNAYNIGAIVKGKELIIKPGEPIPDQSGDFSYEGNPHISHFINLLLYGFLCVLLYWLFLEMLNPKRDPGNLKANFISFVAAMLYAAHPIHTEAVANIKGRDEILVLMGSIMALYWTLKAYNQRHTNQQFKYIGFAVLGFLMGIFSKENAITFVAIIPVALYLFTDAKPADIGLRTLPFIAVCLLFWFGVRKIIFLDMNTYEIAKEYMNDPFMKVAKAADGTAEYLSMDFSERYGFIIYTWLEYFKLLVFPHPLTNDYYPLHLTYNPDGEVIPALTHPLTILSILFHLGLAGLFIWGIMRRHIIAFCVIFYAATFSVVSNLFFAIGTVMAERFMFLPSVGFSLAMAVGLWFLGERLQKGKEVAVPTQIIKIPLIIFVVITGLYSVKTFIRNFAWENDQVLFVTDIAVSKNSAKLNNAVSGIYMELLVEEQKLPATTQSIKKRNDYIQKALNHAKRAIELHPMYNQAWLLLGNAYVYSGDAFIISGDETKLDSAVVAYYNSIQDYKFVLQLRYDHPDAIKNMWISHYKMAIAYENRGIAAQQKNDLTAASQYFGGALKAYDDFLTYVLTEYPKLYNNFPHPDINYNVGNAYRERGQLLGKRIGQLDMSIQSLEKAQSYLPGDSNIPRMLGVANGIKGDHIRAIEFFEKALQIGGENLAILYNLEVAHKELIRVATAQGVDPAVIATYEEKQKNYHERWFRMNPNYDPSKDGG